MQFLECEPEIAGDAAQDCEIIVEPLRDRYRIMEQGCPAKEQLTVETVAEFLHGRIFAISIDDKPTAPLLHAACLRSKGKRILLAKEFRQDDPDTAACRFRVSNRR
jgi:hypothetical protein